MQCCYVAKDNAMQMTSRFAVFAAALLCSVNAAHAVSVSDAVGDFLPSFVGPNDADLDVTSFSVTFNSATSIFTLGAVFAGVVNPVNAGRYVFGVNTGTGVIAPFAAIGQPLVVFNQAVVINKDGTGTVGATALPVSDIVVVGNLITAKVALALLPSTGYMPEQYGWNLWPRNAVAGNTGISDFAPNNALLAINPVPEAGTWVMVIVGFGAAGVALRRRRTVASLT
jgi:PEP-CTERM motif